MVERRISFLNTRLNVSEGLKRAEIYGLLTKLVQSRWLDIGLALF